MKQLNLMTMCGSMKVNRDQIDNAELPEATKTHCPIPHGTLLEHVDANLECTGLAVINEAHAVSEDGQRYFGMLQVADKMDEELDFSTIVGLRNSHDKKFPAGIVVGSGVFVCDNLMFTGEIKVTRKHTSQILEHLPDMIYDAVGKVANVQGAQRERIKAYQEYELCDSEAHDIVVRALDEGAITSTKIPNVLAEWRDPRHQEFRDCGRTMWRLMNAFTEIMKPNESGHGIFHLPKKTRALQSCLDRHYVTYTDPLCIPDVFDGIEGFEVRGINA